MKSEQTDQHKTEADIDVDRAFLALELLPAVKEAYSANIRDISAAIKDSDIVLDTNVLLLPYGAGSSSLKDITKVFERLTSQRRIHLPGQVVREFIKNRPTKIAELQKGIADKLSRVQAPQLLSYPILEEISAFGEVNRILAEIADATKNLQKANTALLKAIRSWEWNDPVTLAYQKYLPSSVIVELEIDKNKLLADLKRRYSLSIPPGYKDAGKEDYGIGDFLIWKTILQIGGSRKKDLIFVSGDEKSDWHHRTDGTAFLPRYELLDEYRRNSDGRALYIVPLSKLLELLNVPGASVEEIKQEEARIAEATTVQVECPYCQTQTLVRLADSIGSSSVPRCPNCDNRFHVHRVAGGVTVHEAADTYKRTTGAGERTEEVVTCPKCEAEAKIMLATSPNSTAWHRCDDCGTRFPIHRRNDGTFAVGGPWR